MSLKDELIRDICSVNSPKIKSEIRRRINEVVQEQIDNSIGALRQFLNEDRIKDASKFVTNEELKLWFKDLK